MDGRLTTAQSVKGGDLRGEAGPERQVIGWDRGVSPAMSAKREQIEAARLQLLRTHFAVRMKRLLTKVCEYSLGNFLIVVPGTGQLSGLSC